MGTSRGMVIFHGATVYKGEEFVKKLRGLAPNGSVFVTALYYKTT